MEYALPREHTTTAVRRVMEMIEQRGFAVPFPIEVRTVAPDDALLSTAAGRDSGFVAVHMFEGMAWEPYFRAVEAIMDELDGRPHWGKRHFQTAATLRPRYPEWDRFQAVRARLDPEGRFANAWTERVLGGCLRRSSSASSARPPGCRRPSPWSISTRCGPTPPTWNAAPLPSRSAWRASRCAAAPCRSGCLHVPAFKGTLAFTLPEALWLASQGVEDMLVAYPTR